MSYLSRIFNNCSETCILSLKSKEERISLKQKIEMKIHLRFCSCCQNFTRQSDMIDRAMKEFFNSFEQQPLLKASDDFKSRMKEKLK